MSTSDRELLELAARAASFDVRPMLKPVFRYEQNGKGESVRIADGSMPILMIGRKEWNPLTDDGDALRLAVKLKLEILFFDGFGEIAVEHNNDGHLQVTEQYSDDMNAATRRAIVRAAAEIGRSMP